MVDNQNQDTIEWLGQPRTHSVLTPSSSSICTILSTTSTKLELIFAAV